jgi:hypothetical protein
MYLSEGIKIDTLGVMKHTMDVGPSLDVFRRELYDRISHRPQDLPDCVGYLAGWISILHGGALP